MLKLFKQLFLIGSIIYGVVFIPSFIYADGQLGDVVYSYLNEAKFVELHGDGWVNYGPERDIRNSAFCKFSGICSLNKVEGHFIRIYGYTSDKIGIRQNYGTALPIKTAFVIKTQGSGRHKHTIKYFVGGAQNGNLTPVGPSNNWMWKSGSGYTEEVPDHTHECTISGGDCETRPYNIALYAYIKINEDRNLGKNDLSSRDQQQKLNLTWQDNISVLQKEIDKLKNEINKLKNK